MRKAGIMAKALKRTDLMADIRPFFVIRSAPSEVPKFTKTEPIPHLPLNQGFAIDFLTCA